MYPNFLGIGPPRTGSTTLWALLRLHPDVEIPEAKELHWFDRKDWDPSSQIRHYERNWSTDKVRGEITTNYCFHLDRIFQTYPDIRLIMTTRNPVDRFLSATVMSYKRNAAKTHSEFEYQQLVERHLLQGEYHADTDYQLRLGDYKKFRDSVNPEQLLVIDFDDLANNQTEVMIRVAEYLGVRPFRNLPYRHENVIPWRFPFSKEFLTALEAYYASK